MSAPSGLHRPLRRGPLDPFDACALVLLVLLPVLIAWTIRDYSISNDEPIQHQYGRLILDYYASGRADHALFRFGNLYLYGGLFDIVAALLGAVIPADEYVIRHVLCAATGVGGIAAAWGTARMIGGPRAGVLAALSLALCGTWLGAMFNHTKDIPFAAAMMGATYFLLRVSRRLPRPQLSDLALLGLLTGAALGLRAIGLLLVPYALAAIALQLPRPLVPAAALRFFGRSCVLFVPAFALAYLAMIAAWPWAALDLLNPVRAIFAFAGFDMPVKTLLDGQTYLMATVPRHYVPLYLAIKLPLFLLSGAVLAVVFAAVQASARRSRAGELRARETALIALAVLVPLTLQVVGRGPAFSGMRHFLFVVPPLAVLAGLGFDAMLGWLATRGHALAVGAAAALAGSFVWTASVLVRLHPYEHLYYNTMVGGLAGAAPRYDTDYWVNVMHEAVGRLEAFLDREGTPALTYRVAVCGERLPFEWEARSRRRLVWATDADPADFFIAPTHMGCDKALDGTVIATIERLGTPIGVVKDRRTLIARQAMEGSQRPQK